MLYSKQISQYNKLLDEKIEELKVKDKIVYVPVVACVALGVEYKEGIYGKFYSRRMAWVVAKTIAFLRDVFGCIQDAGIVYYLKWYTESEYKRFKDFIKKRY